MFLRSFISNAVVVTFIIKQISVAKFHLFVITNVHVSRSKGSMSYLSTFQVIQSVNALYFNPNLTCHNEHEFLFIVWVALSQPIVKLLLEIDKDILIDQPYFISTPDEPGLDLFIDT